MKILMVTALSPSRVGLSEYGALFLEAASTFPNHEFIFAADLDKDLEQSINTPPNIKVYRIWRYNDWLNFFKILQVVLREKPDVIWFNLIMTSFGDRSFPAFLSLMTPFCLRVFGFPCVTTLHHLSAFLDFGSTRYRGYEFVFKRFAAIAEQIIAWSGPVVLLLDKYVNSFKRSYFFSSAIRKHHGFIQLDMPCLPQLRKHILVFGKFGSYKKLDFPISVFTSLRKIDHEYTMTIAGSSHPSYPGYYESFSTNYSSMEGLNFLGYIDDANLGALFANAGIVFLPYSSATGVSGVAHLAGSAGVPIVASEIDDFVAMSEEECMGISFYKPGDLNDAVSCIKTILENPDIWWKMSQTSLNAAQKHSFQLVFHSYLDLFEKVSNKKKIYRS